MIILRGADHDILDFCVRELVNYHRFQPVFQALFSRDLGHSGREKVLSEASTDDNGGMTSTIRTRAIRHDILDFCVRELVNHR